MPQIDADRFLRDLNELRQIGAYKTGVHRPTYSPQDMESRRWLMDRMAEIGLDPSIDGIGNVYGRHQEAGPHLLAGSHIETQNQAGWLDGALGVVAGLALARSGCRSMSSPSPMRRGISRAASSAAAPSSACCRRTRSTAAATAPTARRCATRWRRPGWRASRGCSSNRGGTRASSRCISSRARSWSAPGCAPAWSPASSPSGSGASPRGHAGPCRRHHHGGAARCRPRRGAAAGDARPEFPKICGERSTWTCGRIAVEPGAPSIIPGKADILFQFRDIDVAVLERMERCLRACVQESNRRERTTATLSTSASRCRRPATRR